MTGVLEGRTAIVTGGAAGIGGGISRSFAEAGATVICLDIDQAAIDDLPDGTTENGGRIESIAGDVRAPDAVERVCEAALTAGDGRVDVLVNNVGDYRPNGRFITTDEADWEAQYDINLRHVFRMTHAVLPSMIKNGGGSIVNVSTVEAYRGIPHNTVYSAFKAGVVAFTRSLAVEVGGLGVRVNAIAPDLADTPQTPAARMLGGRDPGLIESWVPLGRFGHVSDYAEVVLFLASDQSRFVTGQTIAVDGGTLAASGWYRRASARAGPTCRTRPSGAVTTVGGSGDVGDATEL